MDQLTKRKLGMRGGSAQLRGQGDWQGLTYYLQPLVDQSTKHTVGLAGQGAGVWAGTA